MSDYKNIKEVTVKESRECMFCHSIILSGSKSITVNKRMQGRKWICMLCADSLGVNNLNKKRELNKCVAEVKAKIKSAEAEMSILPFGDEGGYLACINYIEDLYKELDTLELIKG